MSIHDKPTPPNSFEPEETPTGISCLSCAGHYRIVTEKPNGYSMRICCWCSQGMMTPGQVAKWKSRKKQP